MTAQEKSEFEERIVSRVKKEVAEAFRTLAREWGRPGSTLNEVLERTVLSLTPKPEPVKVPEVDWAILARLPFTSNEWKAIAETAALLRDNKLKIVPVAEREK